MEEDFQNGDGDSGEAEGDGNEDAFIEEAGDAEGNGNEDAESNVLDALHDDVLLQVISYLTPRQLFECRMVCRRLRDLAVHPYVWREKNLKATTVNCCRLAAAALRVAPCLRSLSVEEPLVKDLISGRKKTEGTTLICRLGTLLASTRCAISELDLLISPADAVLVAVMLARQSVLGRLKTFCLMALTYPDTSDESSLYCLKQLLEQLLYTPGLQTIELDIDVNADAFLNTPALLDASKHEAPVPAALRELVYFTKFRDPGFLLQLEWHRATLEVLEVMTAPPHLAPLLADMPHLRELMCPLMPDLQVLLECSKLKSLHLIVPFEESASAPFLPGAASYLRTAVSRLESTVLEFVEGESRAEALDLVLALGGSRGAVPALRSVTIMYTGVDGHEEQDTVRTLAAILHRLEHLVTLHIGGVLDGWTMETGEAFLDLSLLDGKVLPRLEELSFVWHHNCPHEWAHGEEARSLMRRYPRLHVDLNSYHSRSESKCEYCEENECHNFDDAWITLFSHPRGAPCAKKHQVRDVHISLD